MRVLILATSSETTNYLINSLINKFNVEIIFENRVPRKIFWKNRIKKLGLLKVFNQICFLIFINLFGYFYKKEKFKIISKEMLSQQYLSNIKIEYVESINSQSSAKLIASSNVDIIIINGTRILSRDLLESIRTPILNIHCGITPKYRGVHGGYWALYNQDIKNLGVTIHRVDAGIDTGGIIFQDNITVSNKDNYFTYPIKQYQKALPALISILLDYRKSNKLPCMTNTLPSHLWSHPTLIEYLNGFIFKNVK